ncbi:MAG: RidA family protein [Acetobacteraceae bacterium]
MAGLAPDIHDFGRVVRRWLTFTTHSSDVVAASAITSDERAGPALEYPRCTIAGIRATPRASVGTARAFVGRSTAMPAQIKRSNPAAVKEPTGYTHAIEITGDARRLIISGQVGMAPDGTVPPGGEAQIAQAFANLRAILTENGMGVENIVKTTVFLTDRDLLAAFRAARGAVFGTHAPASTLLFVAGLADPKFMVEIEAEAVA